MTRELRSSVAVPIPAPVPVIVVGAGPTGLTLALVLAGHGVACVVVDDDGATSTEGSRSICVQGHSLAILDRVGAGAVRAEGVQWNIGRTYHRGREIGQSRIAGGDPDAGPRFVNIGQSRVEAILAEAVRAHPLCATAWAHRVDRVDGIRPDAAGVDVAATGPDGAVRRWRAQYVVGADGGRSTVRGALGIAFEPPPGQPDVDDPYLVVDVRAELPFPAERRFFFDPPWNPGRQVLLHPQPDGVWRIDWQVPPGFDLGAETASGGLDERIRAVVGDATAYEVLWSSVYTVRQRLAERFRVGRVFLAGDAAHVMSVFGARGMNSGIQDADNLGWKLAFTLKGDAAEGLLDSYEAERREAAVANLEVTGATMRFLAPPTGGARLRRRLVLAGAPYAGFLRRKVDSGRLSEPAVYRDSSTVQPGCGALAPDLPVRRLGGTAVGGPGPAQPDKPLRSLRGGPFVVVAVGPTVEEASELGAAVDLALDARPGRTERRLPPYVIVAGAAADASGDTETAGAALGNLLVVRPDGHLAWKVNGEPAPDEVADALAEALLRASGG